MYAKAVEIYQTQNHSLQVLEIQSFKHLLEQSGENFIQQHYTTIERSVSDTGKRRIQYLAGRWAAKIAIANILGQNNMRCSGVLGVSLMSDCIKKPSGSWLNIEVLRLPTGQPSVRLLGQYQQEAIRLDIKQWFISISHTSKYAVASVAVGK